MESCNTKPPTCPSIAERRNVMKMKTISFRIAEEEEKFLEMSAKKANMNKTEYQLLKP